MDPGLYRAAKEGNLQVLLQHRDQFEAQMTPTENSVLHVAALFNKSDVVKEILTAQPLLLCKVNIKGDTALHIAAREGHFSIVQALIECAKEMADSELESGIGMAKKILRMTNKAGNTALHEAVWNKDHLNVVDLLAKEDPEFSHPANNTGETPLYIAAERGFVDIVSEILKTCTSPAYGGPDGRTALHGAVIRNRKGCTTQLLEWKHFLTKESDIHGWTPLHYAAGHGLLSMVRRLLKADISAAYLTTCEDNKMTPLHLSVIWGRVKVMELLISECPDCWEMVDSKGQNILHLASRNMQWDVINVILEDSSLDSLINQRDDEGNTPLHLLATFCTNYEFTLDKTCVINMLKDPRVNKNAFNKEKLTPLDVTTHNYHFSQMGWLGENLAKFGAEWGGRNKLNTQNAIREKRRKVREERNALLQRDFRKSSDTMLIVAAFIATVTFAAGFTVPGGYDGNPGPNQGIAVLTRAAAFKAFVITNTLAMVLSTCAVFFLLITASRIEGSSVRIHMINARTFIYFSIGAMWVAFMTGSYAVLVHSPGLAIFVCSFVGSSFLLLIIKGRLILQSIVSSLKKEPF